MSTSTEQMIDVFRESNSLEKILIDNADEALYFYSMEGKLIYVNPAFQRITGFTTQELIEKNFIPFVHPDDEEWTMKLWEGLYKGELFEDVEYRIVNKKGDIRWSLSSWKIVCDHNGNQIGIQGKHRDITKRKKAVLELEAARNLANELARTDDLTKLNNRRSFFERGNLVLRSALRYDHPMSIVMMDIDNFKNINDTHGHAVGDNVLRFVAGHLRDMMREVDVVARLGGDEFVLILPETPLEGAVSSMERLKKTIATTAIKVENEVPIHITVSIGICSCSVKNGTLETLLAKADTAMYKAKLEIRNLLST